MMAPTQTVATPSATRLVRIPVALLVALCLFAVLGPFLSPYSYEATDLSSKLSAPALSDRHYFGTDELGRDLYVRSLLGIRISMTVAIVASLVSLVIGVAYGAIAGYAGGRVDAAMMRMVDTLYALPFIFFVILLAAFFGRSFFLIFVAIGAVNWLDMARIVRGQTLSLREREFVQAARLYGVRPAAILARHIVPNLAGIVIVYLALTIPQTLLVESFLSFIGLGVQEPETSLGSLVNEGVRNMELAPWTLLIPAAFLAVILLAFNFLGDGLRDQVDAKEPQ